MRGIAFAALAAVLASPSDSLAVGGPATVIHWGTAQGITADSDVLNTGAVVAAYSFGATGDSGATVNGVTFAPFIIPDDGSTGSTTVGNFSMSVGGRFSSTTAFGSTAAPFSTLSLSYQALLSSGTGSGPDPYAIGLSGSGLTIGKTYSVEWWANDAGLGFNPTALSVSAEGAGTGNTAVFLTDNANGTHGSPGQFDIGTFTAATTGLTIDFEGTSTSKLDLNAFLLENYVAPEPATGALAAAGLAALLCSRPRRRPAKQSVNPEREPMPLS